MTNQTRDGIIRVLNGIGYLCAVIIIGFLSAFVLFIVNMQWVGVAG